MSDERTLARLLRRSYPRVLARVLSVTKDLAEAEDRVQEAMERALRSWPSRGLPDAPEAWLLKVAQNRYLDGLRRRQRARRHQDTLSALAQQSPWSTASLSLPALHHGWEDDLLRLLFTCCDPVLSVAEAAALTLSTVIGLSIREVAAAFVVQPRTMEQRLTRARARLRQRRGDYLVPEARRAVERVDAALCVVHLVFNEGYWSAQDETPIRAELCALAIGLARSLHALLPRAPEVAGLLALLLFIEARQPARLDAGGTPLTLLQQDRSRYDHTLLGEATALLDGALARGAPGPFQIEAAIAALHSRAAHACDTDWAQIAQLYAALEHHRPTPVVRINRAFAVGRAEGPAAGLALLDDAEPQLSALRYAYAPLVRAVLLGELSRDAEASDQLLRAKSLARNGYERAEIERRLTETRARAAASS